MRKASSSACYTKISLSMNEIAAIIHFIVRTPVTGSIVGSPPHRIGTSEPDKCRQGNSSERRAVRGFRVALEARTVGFVIAS